MARHNGAYLKQPVERTEVTEHFMNKSSVVVQINILVELDGCQKI